MRRVGLCSGLQVLTKLLNILPTAGAGVRSGRRPDQGTLPTVMTGHVRRMAGLAAAFALAAVLVACGDDGSDDLPPPASPAAAAPSSTIPPEQQEILDVYYGSVQASVAAQRAGDRDHPDLARYFGGNTPALLDVQLGIDRNDEQGIYYDGELVVVTATVTDLDLEAEPPQATIESCLDDSDYRLVRRADGSPVENTEPGGRYSVTSTASPDAAGRWYVVQSIAHWDEPC